MFFAKLVIDKETESNKGTGFVKFKEPAVAKKLIEASESFERDGVKSSVIDLELTGRRLICFSAMKRKEIENKLEEKKNLKDGPKIDLKKVKYLDQLVSYDKFNKRKINLAQRGIFSPEDKELNENDIENRKLSLKEKIEKLKNPNMAVSEVRITFKGLPKNDFDE